MSGGAELLPSESTVSSNLLQIIFDNNQKKTLPQTNWGCYPRHQEASTRFSRAICGSALSDVTTGVLEITGETFRDPWKVV